MDSAQAQFLGYFIMAVVTIGGFIGIVNKITQPINELKIVISELKECIRFLQKDQETHKEKIEEFERRISHIEKDVGILSKLIDTYCRDGH